LFSALISYQSERVRGKVALMDKLEKSTEIASIALANPIWNFNTEGIKSISDAFIKDQEIASILILDTKGNELYKNVQSGNDYADKFLIYSETNIQQDGKLIGKVKIAITQSFYLAALHNTLSFNLLSLIVMISILVVVITIASAVITKPLKELCLVVNQVASGNLTATVLQISNDEIGDLAQQVNHMTNRLYSMVNKIQEVAENLSASSEELSASTNTNLEIAEEIASASRLIAGSTDEQAVCISDITSVIVNMDATINEVMQEIVNAATRATNSTAFAENGMKSVENAIHKMKEMSQAMDNSVSIVNGLSHLSEKIVRFVDIIKNITSQTNLLSLNASIEAARAGDAGRSFAVVADEVRKLADQSSTAALQISDIVSEIKGSIKNATDTMNSGAVIAQEGTQTVQEAGASLAQIVESTKDVKLIIQQMALDATHQSHKSHSIVDEIGKISTSAATTASSAHQTSSCVDTQKQSLSEVAKAINTLSCSAEKLTELTAQFNTRR